MNCLQDVMIKFGPTMCLTLGASTDKHSETCQRKNFFQKRSTGQWPQVNYMQDKDLNARVSVLEETTRLQFKELFLRLKRIEMIMLASAAAIIGLLSSILAGQ